MARYLIRHPDTQPPLSRSKEKDGRLVDRLVYELEDARSGKRFLDQVVMEARRQYAGKPESAVRNQPIPNSPNIELPIGALISDSLYAQASDTLYSALPIITAREMDDYWSEHAKHLQKLVTWMADNEIGLRYATDNAFQDDVQLGTGVLYCPWVCDEKVTKVFTIVHESPRVIPITIEDFLVPAGSRGDPQQDDWMDIRFWYTPSEFRAQARMQKWDISGSMPTAQQDHVRQYYEAVNNEQSAGPAKEKYAVENVWIYHDYENDGIDRDMMVSFDAANRKILGVGYNRYDVRPVETMRYQIRPHLFWGLGVMEMVQPFQKAGTDTLNHFLLNMMLVNGRMYAARSGTVDDFQRVYPMKIIDTDSPENIKELKLADIYPSILMGLDRLIQLAERRVGVTGEFTSGSPASRVLGTRTPGITAMTAMQSVNRRFAPAFDGMRLNAAAAVRQCVWRYAERVRANDQRVINHLTRLLGEKGAQLVFELFRQDDFERCVAVEFTAVSASVNRESDRQNALLLLQQLGGYYSQVVAGVQQLSAQPSEGIVYDATKKGLEAMNFAMDMLLRSFTQVRNPEKLLLNLSAELDAAKQDAEAQQMIGSIIQQIGGGGMPGEEGGGMAPPTPPPGTPIAPVAPTEVPS